MTNSDSFGSDPNTASTADSSAEANADALAAKKPTTEKKVAPRSADKKPGDVKPADNRVVKLLEKNQLGMTLPEMAGGPRQVKKIRTLRPLLAEAIRAALVMPVSQRAGHTVYRLVKYLGPR